MPKYLQTTFTAPVAGRDDEFNRWYDEIHLLEVLQVRGFVAGQRYALAGPGAASQPRYLAVYDIETDDLAATLEALASAGPRFTLSDAMDMSATASAVYEVLGERRTASGDFDGALDERV